MEPTAPTDRFLAAMNGVDTDALRRSLSSDFVFEDVAGAGEPSISALLLESGMIRGAFPDIQFRPVRWTPTDGRTLVEFRAIGTHLGEFLNVPATGATAIVSGVFNLQVAGETISRLRLTVDFGGLRRQLLLAARAPARKESAQSSEAHRTHTSRQDSPTR